MKRLLVFLMLFSLTTSVLLAKGWRTDESEKYLRWWDRTYQGTDSAIIGAIAYQKGDYQTAIAELEKAVQAGSQDGRVYYQLAYSYQQLGDFDKAIELYQKAIKLLEGQVNDHRYCYYASYNLALLYGTDKDIDKAIAVLRSAVERYPQETELRNLLGWLYWRKGDSSQALKEYQASIAIHEDQEDAQYNLGILYYNEGEFKAAKNTFQKVIALNPDNQKAEDYLKILENKQLLTKKGTASLLVPEPAKRHCSLGKQYLDKNDYEEAAEKYETALEVDPNCVEAHQGLGVIYEYNVKGIRYGDNFNAAKSIFHYEKALELCPDLEEVEFNLAVLYEKQGHLNRALQQYLQLLRLDPSNAGAHYNLAVLYDNKIKNPNKAIYHYNRYLDLDPDSPKKVEIKERISNLKRLV